MENRRPVHAEPYVPKQNEGNNRGGGGGRTTPMNTACMSRRYPVGVCQKKTLEEMIYIYIYISISNQQQKGARQVQRKHITNLFLKYVPTHDRLNVTGKRPQQRSQGPQQQQSTPSVCLLTTTFEWRSFTTGGTCIIQPSGPRG